MVSEGWPVWDIPTMVSEGCAVWDIPTMVSAGRAQPGTVSPTQECWNSCGKMQVTHKMCLTSAPRGMNQHSLAACCAGNTGGVWGAVGVILGRKHGNCFGSCVVIQNPSEVFITKAQPSLTCFFKLASHLQSQE